MMDREIAEFVQTTDDVCTWFRQNWGSITRLMNLSYTLATREPKTDETEDEKAWRGLVLQMKVVDPMPRLAALNQIANKLRPGIRVSPRVKQRNEELEQIKELLMLSSVTVIKVARYCKVPAVYVQKLRGRLEKLGHDFEGF